MTEKPFEITYKIENIVMIALIHTTAEGLISLVDVAAKVTAAEYNPERFPGIVLRIQNPKVTVLLFSTKKCVITGVKSVSDMETIKNELVKILKMAKINVTSVDMSVVNMVASGKVANCVDLNLATITIPNTLYEPEVFPGAVIRLSDPKAVFLLFSTGSTVCTAIKEEALFKSAHNNLRRLIVENKLDAHPPESLDLNLEDNEEINFL